MSKPSPNASNLDRVVGHASSIVKKSYLLLGGDFPPGFAEGAPLRLDTERARTESTFELVNDLVAANGRIKHFVERLRQEWLGSTPNSDYQSARLSEALPQLEGQIAAFLAASTYDSAAADPKSAWFDRAFELLGKLEQLVTG